MYSDLFRNKLNDINQLLTLVIILLFNLTKLSFIFKLYNYFIQI